MTNQRASIRVVLADDHPVVLQGLSSLLRAEGNFEVLATLPNGAAALKAIRDFGPDVAVLDLSMPEMTGIEVLNAVTAEGLVTKVIILTAEAGDSQVLAAVAGGVRGIMLKDAAPDALAQCIRHVAEGGRWLPHDLVDEALSRESGRRTQADRLGSSLTVREREVVLLVAEGLSNKEVARKLKVSEGTVKIHLHNIYQKLEVTNRTALAAMALAHREQLTP